MINKIIEIPTLKMRQTAKVLGYGRNKFFQRLREMKILDKHDIPFKKYVDRGYFDVKEHMVNDQSYCVAVARVTLEGLNYLRKVLSDYFNPETKPIEIKDSQNQISILKRRLNVIRRLVL